MRITNLFRTRALRLFSALVALFWSSALLAGSFTSYPTTTDTDGTYTLTWTTAGGAGTVISTRVKEYKNGIFTSDVATSGTSVTLSGRQTASYRYDLQLTRRTGGVEGDIVTSVEDSVTVTVSVVLDPPTVSITPSGVSSNGSFDVSWNSVSGATSYRLDEQIGNGSWVQVQDNSTTSRSYSGKAANDYNYRVQSCAGSACSNESATASIEVAYPPAQPPTITSSAVTTTEEPTGTFSISWGAVSNATSYTLQRWVNTYWSTQQTGTATTRLYQNFAIGSYDFRVRACNTGGCSNWSATFTKTLSQVPNITGTSPNRETFTLTVTGAVGNTINVNRNGARILTGHAGRSFTRTESPGTYSYTAEICNSDDGFSNCHGFGLPFSMTVIAKPGTPSSVTPAETQSIDGSFNVSWGSASGEVHEYQLQQQTNGSWSTIYTGTALTRSVSNLADGSYLFRVRACNTIASVEECSNYRTSSTVKVYDKPTAPTVFTVPSSDADGSISVSWSGTTGPVTYYQVQEREVGTSWPAAATNTETTTTSTTLSGLTEGDWEFRVRACNTEDWACSGYKTSTTTTILSAPTNVTTTTGNAVAKNQNYTVNFSASGTVTTWTLYERLATTSSWAAISGVSGTSHSLTKSTAGQTWEYYTRACNTSIACTDSSVASQEILPDAPTAAPDFTSATNFTTTNNSRSITLQWSAISGATQYQLESLNSSTNQWSVVQNNSTRSYTGTYIIGTHEFRVSACNSGGCSGSRSETIVISLPSNINVTSPARETFNLSVDGIGDRLDIRENGIEIISKQDVSDGNKSVDLTRTPGDYTYQAQLCTFISSNTYNCNGWGAEVSVSVVGKPGTPSSITPAETDSIDGAFAVNWGTASGEVHEYQLQQQTNGSWSTVYNGTLLTHSVSNLADGSYLFRIRACNTIASIEECSSYRTSSSVKVYAKPTAPTIFTVPSSDADGSINVSWSGTTGTATYYQIQQRQVGGSWPAATTNTQTTSASATLSGLTEGDWEFRVRACNTEDWACSGYKTSTSVAINLPPTNVAIQAGAAVAINQNYSVSFSATGPVTAWTLFERKASTTTWLPVAGVSGTSHTFSKTTAAESWEYYAQACNTGIACVDSSVVTQQILANAPSTVPAFTSATNYSTTDVTHTFDIIWSSVTDATSYTLEENRAGAWTVIPRTGNDTSRTLNNYAAGSYEFRVNACNEGGCGNWSATFTVTITRTGNISGPHQARATFTLTISGVGDHFSLKEDGVEIVTEKFGIAKTETLTRAAGSYVYEAKTCTLVDGVGFNCSAWGLPFTVTVVASPGAPASISLAPLQTTNTTLDVSWGAASGEVHEYQLQQQMNTGNWSTVYSGSATSSSETSLADGNYLYQVRACNTVDNLEECSSYVTSTTAEARLLPAVPASITAPSTIPAGEAIISWSESDSNASYYEVQSQQDAGQWQTPITVTLPADLTTTYTNLADGEWRFRVRACNQVDWSCSAYKESSAIDARTLPTNVSVTVNNTAPVNQAYSVNFSADGAVTSWTLSERKLGETVWNVVAGVSGNSKNFTKTVVGETWEYQARACNTISACVDSNIGSTTILDESTVPGGVIVADAPFVEPTVPENQSIGALEGNGGVSGGAASYSIPIALPPGRAGMQPNVGLTYSSRGGNGIAGMGWGLSASTSISRCSATAAQDGFTAAPQYDASRDKLCLNGQRLMLVSGAYGTNGAVYRTELDNFGRVTQYSNINSQSSRFKVDSKNGLTSLYGASDDSKHSAEDRNEILSWAITAVKDQAGNMMSYHYNNHGSGEFTLSKIKYTGDFSVSNSEGRRGANGDREVVFNYENRVDANGATDYHTSYLAGGKTRMTKRLSDIQTFYAGTKIRQYNLTYGDMSLSTGRTLLRNAQECAYKAGVEYCLPSTQFDWQEAEPKYALEPVTLENGTTDVYPHTGQYITNLLPKADVDGDGVRDWPGIVGTDGAVIQDGFMANAERDYKGTHSESLGGCYRKSAFQGSIQCHSADFNQDGKTDTYRVDGNIFVKFAGSAAWIDTGITLGFEQDRIISLSDFNADGWPDITVRQAETEYGVPDVYIYFNSKNTSSLFSASNRDLLFTVSVNNPNVPYSYLQDVQEIGDMDGNGTSDFIVYLNPLHVDNKPGMPRPSELILTQSEVGGDLSYSEYAFTGFFVDRVNDHLGEAYLFHDVNADGLNDWLTINNSGNLHVKYNLGGSFSATWVDLGIGVPMRRHDFFHQEGEPDLYLLPMMERTMVMDYDGDGRSELMIAEEVVASACSLVFHYPVINGPRVEEYMCGDALWKSVRLNNGSAAKTPIQSALKDVSARKYNAVYFAENLDGTIATSVVPTDIVAAPVERAVIDAFGNGLADVVTSFECKIDGCFWNTDTSGYTGSIQDPSLEAGKLYINRNIGASLDENGYAANDVMSKVTDGLGIEKLWTYRPLGSEQYDEGDVPFYDPDHDYLKGDVESGDQSYFHFGSSMMVVAEYQMSSGLGNLLNSTKYKYRGAIYNNKGRGFQGFRSIIVDSPTGIRAVTDFHQMFPLSGKIEFARSCKLSNVLNPDCEISPITSNHAGYKTINSVLSNPNIKWVFSAKTISKNFEPNETNIIQTPLSIKTSYVGLTDPGDDFDNLSLDQSAYDLYGNILESVSLVDSGFGVNEVQTQLEFYPHVTSSWWVNKLKTTTVTTKALDMTGVTWSPYTAAASLDGDKTVVTTINTYDELQRKASKVTVNPTVGKQSVVETVYNTYGQPTQVTAKSPDDAAASDRVATTTYSTDTYFAQTITNDVGSVTTYTNPNHGQPDSAYDLNSIVTLFQYDAFGRLEQSTSDGSPKSYARYAACDNCDGIGISDVVYKVTSYSAGVPETTEYRDKLNRVLAVKTEVFGGTAAYVHITYDELGRKTFESVPSASTSSMVGTYYQGYDVLGRLTSKLVNKTEGQGFEVEYLYGTDGTAAKRYQTQVVVNNYGRVLYRTHNGIGQLMQTTDALGTPGVTRYAYDGSGNPIALVDANGERITAKYNDLGQKLFVEDPNMGRKDFVYTGFGELESELDALGNTTSYQYDTTGRLTQRSVGGPNETAISTFEFDVPVNTNTEDKCHGLPSKEYKGNEFSRSYHYDLLCRLVSTQTIIDGEVYAVSTQIDSNYGRAKAVTYPNGLTVAYDYSGEGYLKRTYNAANDYVYREITAVDEQGNWTNANLVNNNSTVIRNFNPETGQMESTEWFNSNLSQQRLAYQYDKYGNLEQQSVINKLGETSTENYAYDDMHRLTSTSRSIPGLSGNLSYYFDYDSVGNILKKTDFSIDSGDAYQYGSSSRGDANGWAGPNAVRTVMLESGGRTYSYDKNGNLTSDGIRNIEYNAFNKPKRISVIGGEINPELDSQVTGASEANLYYGSDEMRYKQIKSLSGDTSTHIYIGKSYEVVTEVKANGATTVRNRSYVDDIAVVTETTEGASPKVTDTTFYHRDRLGSMTAEINNSGVIVNAHSYDAFGRPRNENMSDKGALQQLVGLSTNRGFTDHEHLDESQLIHMNGRAYDYNLGRFLSVDPVIQSPGNSQSMNPYSYIMNNPLSGTDPSGYTSETDEEDDSDDSCQIGNFAIGGCKVVGDGFAQTDNGKDSSESNTPKVKSKPVDLENLSDEEMSKRIKEIAKLIGSIETPSTGNTDEVESPVEGYGQESDVPPVVNLTTGDIWQSTFAGIGNAFANAAVGLANLAMAIGDMDGTAEPFGTVQPFQPRSNYYGVQGSDTGDALMIVSSGRGLGKGLAGIVSARFANVSAKQGAIQNLVSTTAQVGRKKAGFSDNGIPVILDTNLQTKGFAEALRARGFNVRSVTEIFGKDPGDVSISKLADRIGAKVLTRDRGRQLDGGFGQNAIQVDGRVRGIDGLTRALELGL